MDQVTTEPDEPEWETANERVVKWDREQTIYLYKKLGWADPCRSELPVDAPGDRDTN